jgi:hypothetical protein
MRLQRMYIHMYCSESKIIFKYNKSSWVPLYEHNIFFIHDWPPKVVKLYLARLVIFMQLVVFCCFTDLLIIIINILYLSGNMHILKN